MEGIEADWIEGTFIIGCIVLGARQVAPDILFMTIGTPSCCCEVINHEAVAVHATTANAAPKIVVGLYQLLEACGVRRV